MDRGHAVLLEGAAVLSQVGQDLSELEQSQAVLLKVIADLSARPDKD
jgi:hypothetical protein